jgi:hypothetical protein
LKTIVRLVTVGTIGMALFVTGCSKNPPCETDPAQIEDARAELQAAQGQLDSAKSELQTAEAQKKDLQQKLQQLPDKGQLEERLYVLKKGSGR